MADGSEEQKIIFLEGDDIRKLQGTIIKEDAFFIYLKRNDGEYRIGKQFVIKIEPEKNRRVDNATGTS